MPIRHPQLIPSKTTRRKLKQFLQPQELVPSGALFWCPQTSHKATPRFRKRIKIFSHNSSLVLSFSFRRNSTRVHVFQLPARQWEHCISPPPSPAFLQQRTWCCGRRFCLSGKHAQAPLEIQIIPDSVLWRAAMQGTSVGFSSYSALTLPCYLCFSFFLCNAERNAWANYSNYFFFGKPSNMHLFLNTSFDHVCGSSLGYRLVTGVVKLMKSLLFSLIITRIWPKGKWSLNGKKRATFSYSNSCVMYFYINLKFTVSLGPHTFNSLPAVTPGSGI